MKTVATVVVATVVVVARVRRRDGRAFGLARGGAPLVAALVAALVWLGRHVAAQPLLLFFLGYNEFRRPRPADGGVPPYMLLLLRLLHD